MGKLKTSMPFLYLTVTDLDSDSGLLAVVLDLIRIMTIFCITKMKVKACYVT